jgi:uncharacterized protein
VGDLEVFRAVIEAAVQPLATSIDGRSFTFQASPHGLDLQTGGYVVVEDASGSRLGQVLSLGLDTEEATTLQHAAADATATATQSRVLVRVARGAGAILDGDGRPFHEALARPASPDEVRRWLDATTADRAQLDVGELAMAPGVAYAFDAVGFGRHTFLCGQSGSGRTHALGVVLERLLMETTLPIVVLDPNSDYVHLNDVRDDVAANAAARYAAAAQAVAVRGDSPDAERISLRPRDLETDELAALLRLGPISDREEYAELARLVGERAPRSRLRDLFPTDRDESRGLALRAANLGIDRWTLWADPSAASLADDFDQSGQRCLVVDLGSLGSPEEHALVAGAVLRMLWRRRPRREPMLIVIDEAHNVCPQQPTHELMALPTEDAIRIAREGRKFGLYLLLATQRPDKLHIDVLSECDNLVLMRMNSAAELGVVGNVFSFVPPGLLERAKVFRQGEALAAGKISSHPALIRFGARLSREGGGDVPGTSAAQRSEG